MKDPKSLATTDFSEHLGRVEAFLAELDAVEQLRADLENRISRRPEGEALEVLTTAEKIFYALDRFHGICCCISISQFFEGTSEAIVEYVDIGLTRLGLKDAQAAFQRAKQEFADKPDEENSDEWDERTFADLMEPLMSCSDEVLDAIDEFIDRELGLVA